MKRTIVLSVFALILLVGALPVLGQAAPGGQAPAPAPQAAAQISGELLRVDADAKLLAIKTAEGAEVEFKYTDKTEVSGAQDGVAGLATMKEGQLTVHFTEEGKVKTATKIEVQKKQ